jgi:iron(III) transport system permease protein
MLGELALRRRRAAGVRPATRARPPLPLIAVAGGVAVAAGLPLAYLIVRAVEGGPDALGPLLRARTVELLASTLALGLAVGVGAVVVGGPLAWLTTRTDLPARRAFAVLAIVPVAVPSYLLAFSFVAALGPRGWLASLLRPLGVERLPDIYGFAGAALVLTLATVPYVMLATRAALARLDAAAEEAARSLGDGAWAAARVAVLPVIMPAVGVGALLAMLYAISDFGAVSILRFDSLSRAVYNQYRLSFDRSSAALLALVLVALALALVWLEARVRRRAARSVAPGRHRAPATVPLGRWRWPSLAFCVTIGSLSLALPVLTIAVWLTRGLSAGGEVQLSLDPLWASLSLSLGATVLAVIVALPMARLVAGYPGRWASGVERLLYGIYALPSISLGLAMVVLTLYGVPLLYQTLAALVFAVALHFLAQPVGALRGPFGQISPRTIEAARSLGERPLGVLRTITLPLLRPGIVAGAALVFLSAMKELPLTLLLAPTGFRTLATRLWDAAREGFFAQAAVPAAVLLLVSSLSVVLLVRRGEGPT